MDNKAGHQNSDRNPCIFLWSSNSWKDFLSNTRVISQEFHTYLIFWSKYFSIFLEEFWSNPGRISQKFHGHLILEELNSHLNRLATRILIKTLVLHLKKNEMLYNLIKTFVEKCKCFSTLKKKLLYNIQNKIKCCKTFKMKSHVVKH